MTRFRGTFLLCALAALLAGCNQLPDAFEDVGNDPHPPELTLLGVGLQLPAPDAETDPPPPAYVPPTEVITLRPYDAAANQLALRVSYADAAADINSITIRDLDGSIGGDVSFTDFPGTSGVFEFTVQVPLTAAEGRHELEIWAKDDNDSRSAKTTFAVTVQLL